MATPGDPGLVEPSPQPLPRGLTPCEFSPFLKRPTLMRTTAKTLSPNRVTCTSRGCEDCTRPLGTQFNPQPLSQKTGWKLFRALHVHTRTPRRTSGCGFRDASPGSRILTAGMPQPWAPRHLALTSTPAVLAGSPAARAPQTPWGEHGSSRSPFTPLTLLPPEAGADASSAWGTSPVPARP